MYYCPLWSQMIGICLQFSGMFQLQLKNGHIYQKHANLLFGTGTGKLCLYKKKKPNTFITFIIVSINCHKNALSLSNKGLEESLVVKTSGTSWLKSHHCYKTFHIF